MGVWTFNAAIILPTPALVYISCCIHFLFDNTEHMLCLLNIRVHLLVNIPQGRCMVFIYWHSASAAQVPEGIFSDVWNDMIRRDLRSAVDWKNNHRAFNYSCSLQYQSTAQYFCNWHNNACSEKGCCRVEMSDVLPFKGYVLVRQNKSKRWRQRWSCYFSLSEDMFLWHLCNISLFSLTLSSCQLSGCYCALTNQQWFDEHICPLYMIVRWHISQVLIQI